MTREPIMVQTKEASRRFVRSMLTAVFLAVGAMATCDQAFGQIAQMGICKPASQRTGEVGCWIMTNKTLGQLPCAPIFSHLDAYPTRAAAEAATGTETRRALVLVLHDSKQSAGSPAPDWTPKGLCKN